MRTTILLVASGLALAACGNPTAKSDDPLNDGDPAGTPVPAAPESAQVPGADLAQTMPRSLRGDWHRNDLGRAPDAADCDERLRGTIDWDRLITVRETGYSYFETGGRIVDVHARTDSMIDATFDTTYADTPTSERRNFALQPDGTLAVSHETGEGTTDVAEYRRCPEGRE